MPLGQSWGRPPDVSAETGLKRSWQESWVGWGRLVRISRPREDGEQDTVACTDELGDVLRAWLPRTLETSPWRAHSGGLES